MVSSLILCLCFIYNLCTKIGSLFFRLSFFYNQICLMVFPFCSGDKCESVHCHYSRVIV